MDNDVIKDVMNLEILNKSCNLYHMDENREIPRELYRAAFFSATRTDKGLTIICDSDIDFACCRSVENLRLLRLKDSLDFEVTGIIHSLAEILAEHNISILVISTYENIYITFQDKEYKRVVEILTDKGYSMTCQI